MSDKPEKEKKATASGAIDPHSTSAEDGGACTAKLESTLFDLAKAALKAKGPKAGDLTKDAVYHELNSIMVRNSYEKALLDGKKGISDRDLPKSWNNVQSDQQFKLCDNSEPKYSAPELAIRKGLAEQIKSETSTDAVQAKEGYFQVLKRMYPQREDGELTRDAHRIKRINGNRENLKVGERLATATEEERALELERRFAIAVRQAPKPEPASPEAEKVPEAKPVLKPHVPAAVPRPVPTSPEAAKPDPGAKPVLKPHVPAAIPGPVPTSPEAAKPDPGAKPVLKPHVPAAVPKPVPTSPEAAKPDPEAKPVLKPHVPAAVPKPVPTSPEAPKVPEAKPAPPKPQAPAAQALDLERIYKELRAKHHFAASELAAVQKSQGVIGRAFDGAKNNLGSSGEGHAWYDPRRVWSGLFDRELGSRAVDKRLKDEAAKLDELKTAADAKDLTRFTALYRDLTGKDLDPKQKKAAAVKGAGLSDAFDESQHSGVDALTDIGTAVTVAATMRAGKLGTGQVLARTMGVGTVIGGVTKAGLMQVDGHYANLRHDLIAGSLTGAIVPIGELGGAQLSRYVASRTGRTVTGDLLRSRIETQGATIGTRLISAASKSGTSGAIYGGLESPARVALTDVEKGREIKVSELALASLKGMVTGFLAGTVLGASMDGVSDGFKTLRPGTLTAVKTKVGDLDVPSSGAVGLDDAAKILKVEPAELAKDAIDKPYSAVAAAVKLYEKTGLNVSKVDPVTGESVLPKPFAEALELVQSVDSLTAESKTALATKLKVVESTDNFVKANPKAVDDPLASVMTEPDYQEVIKLKASQEGPAAAEKFEEYFHNSLEKDLKTTMAVEQIRSTGATPESTLQSSQTQVEAIYKQKASDYFKDMTDPAQRQRLNELVDDIHLKFSPENLSKGEIEKILAEVPAQDRELAVALMHESAGNSSDVLLKNRLQALQGDVKSQTYSSLPGQAFTLAPDSSANFLGYLYRKSNGLSMEMHNIDNLAEQMQHGYTPQAIVILDDLSSTAITPENLQLLQKIPKVYALDVGAFEKSINVIDVSKGPQAVAEKLSKLLDDARIVQSKNPGLLASGVARETMRTGVDDVASGIGPNVQVIRPSTNLQIPNASSPSELMAMSDVDALHAQYNVPKASKQQIADFLSGYVGEDRELAARMLADGAVHNSFSVMVKKAIELHTKVAEALRSSGLNMRDLLVVSDRDPGGSTHLVSYLFGKANGLSSQNFVSTARVNQMISGGGVSDKVLAYLDDTIYSGSQMAGTLNGNVSGLMPFRKVVIGSLGAYEQGVHNIRSTHLSSVGKVELATTGMHHPFYSDAHPFYSALAAGQKYTVRQIGGSGGFGNVQGSLIWSYMYPDNNLDFFGSKFSAGVLRLPGPW